MGIFEAVPIMACQSLFFLQLMGQDRAQSTRESVLYFANNHKEHRISEYCRVVQSNTEYYIVIQSITKYYKDKSSASTWTNFWACFYGSLKIINKKTKTELAALAALRAICDTIALSQKGAPFLGNLSILVI